MKDCKVATAAGITDMDTQEGIDFCTEKCTEPLCTYDSRASKVILRRVQRSRMMTMMHTMGLSDKEFAEMLHISLRTVKRWKQWQGTKAEK